MCVLPVTPAFSVPQEWESVLDVGLISIFSPTVTNEQFDAQVSPVWIRETLPRQVAPASTCQRLRLREVVHNNDRVGHVAFPKRLARLLRCGHIHLHARLYDLGCLSVRCVCSCDFHDHSSDHFTSTCSVEKEVRRQVPQLKPRRAHGCPHCCAGHPSGSSKTCDHHFLSRRGRR